ncbi:MAG: four helix bundle protein [Terriglobales bacterium]
MSGCYQDLEVWQKPLELTWEVYRGTQHFPNQEIYGLTNQMRRAAVSIASNIAEGKGKSSDREFALFLCHARGSLHELETHAIIAKQLGYLPEDAARRLEAMTIETGKILNGLISSMRPKVEDRRSKLVA